MSDVEKDYDALRKEMSDKVMEAVKLLREASALAEDNKMGSPRGISSWYELEEMAEEFIDFEDKYADRGWSNSGCSF